MLPYATVEEAAVALGRNLTAAESLWFSYSARKSDYFLYCHNILFLFLIFSLVPVPLVLLELARSSGLLRYKIQPKVRLSLSETLSCYRDVMRMFFLVVGPLQLVSFPSVKVPFSTFSISISIFVAISVELTILRFISIFVAFRFSLMIFLIYFDFCRCSVEFRSF